MKALLIVLLFFISMRKSYGQINVVNRIIVFIYTTEQEGYKPIGTGFYSAIPLSRNGKDTLADVLLLCTAKHVLLNPDSTFRKAIAIRLNTQDSSSRFTYVKLQQDGFQQNLFVHEDPTVDMAVVMASPMKSDYNMNFLPTSWILNRGEYKVVEEGDEVFFSGLFTPYLGEKRNYPIIRFGHVALITNERIDFVGYKRELILIESMAFGGNSGSPVFVKYQGREIKLFGVLNGYFNSATPIQIVKAEGDIPVSISNIGIVGITPSYLLSDILNSSIFQKQLNYVKSLLPNK